MAFWKRTSEERGASGLENPSVPLTAGNILMGFDNMGASSTGEIVTTETALTVPAFASGVNFLSGTMAGLPLHVYRNGKDGREKVTGGIATILHDAPNDEMSSFEWRKGLFDNILTGGRAFSYIEKGSNGKVINIWPLDPTKTTVRRLNGRKTYHDSSGRGSRSYAASEILDLPFMLCPDGVKHRSPVKMGAEALGLSIASTKYGARFFRNGGIPPFVLKGNFASKHALERSAAEVREAIQKAASEGRPMFSIPMDLDVVSVGADPQKSQMVEMQRFLVEQIARILSLPPVFLQDLTHGTFANTEQQDLMLVKHTLKRWVEQFEQELNLKLFGRANTKQFVELNVDGLLRGDFKTRMEGYAKGITSGFLTPNEVRAMDNRKNAPHGDSLFIHSANVTLEQAAEPPQPAAEPPQPAPETTPQPEGEGEIDE